mgnify:CR=1 FL=1
MPRSAGMYELRPTHKVTLTGFGQQLETTALLDIGAVHNSYLSTGLLMKYPALKVAMQRVDNEAIDLGGSGKTAPVIGKISLDVTLSVQGRSVTASVPFKVWNSAQPLILGMPSLVGPFTEPFLAKVRELSQKLARTSDANEERAVASRNDVQALAEALDTQAVLASMMAGAVHAERNVCTNDRGWTDAEVFQRGEQSRLREYERSTLYTAQLASLIDTPALPPHGTPVLPAPDDPEDLIDGQLYEAFPKANTIDAWTEEEEAILNEMDLLGEHQRASIEQVGLFAALEHYAKDQQLPFPCNEVRVEVEKNASRRHPIAVQTNRALEGVLETEEGLFRRWWNEPQHVKEALRQAAYRLRLAKFEEDKWEAIPNELRTDPEIAGILSSQLLKEVSTRLAWTTFNMQPQELKLRTGMSAYLKARVRNIPANLRVKALRTIRHQIDVGQWVPGRSNTVSPLVCVDKPNSDLLRICADYTRLNAIIEPCQTHIPTPAELYANGIIPKDTKFLFEIDVTSGYENIPMTQASRELMALATPVGVVLPVGLSMGINSAAAIFQSALIQLTSDLPYLGVIQDGMLFAADSYEQGLERLREVLLLCKEKRININIRKSNFFRQSLEFFGYTLTTTGWTISKDKTEAIDNLAMPSSKTLMRSFLGLCTFCGPFIPRFAELRAPLDEAIKSGYNFLDPDNVRAFEKQPTP